MAKCHALALHEILPKRPAKRRKLKRLTEDIPQTMESI
jgi:hypothetical protein